MESKNCPKIMKMAYEENQTSIFDQAQIWVHTLFCRECAQKIEIYHSARNLMRQNLFSSNTANSAVSLEESIMAKVSTEEFEKEPQSVHGVLSTRGWVITGILILASFATAFFGMDFQNVASETGASFLLPVGILFGIILTTYCAFFIGSHLKELTERFGL